MSNVRIDIFGETGTVPTALKSFSLHHVKYAASSGHCKCPDLCAKPYQSLTPADQIAAPWLSNRYVLVVCLDRSRRQRPIVPHVLFATFRIVLTQAELRRTDDFVLVQRQRGLLNVSALERCV